MPDVTEIQEIIRKRDEDRKYDKWRRWVLLRIPNMSKRVFALRKRLYMGCGFHYSMECSLGKLIAGLNDHNNYRDDMDKMVFRMALEINFSMLMKSIRAAEKSANS